MSQVNRSNFYEAVIALSKTGSRGLDTESTGLRETDRLFCITISDLTTSYYFNFQEYPNVDQENVLPREWIPLMQSMFDNGDSWWFIHNAKHDLKYLKVEGIEIHGTVICTEVQERLVKNNYLGSKPYSLAAAAKRRGLRKDEFVDEYISKHKLYDNIEIPGKKKIVQLKHFELVPFEIISKRATGDADLHYQIGVDQLDYMQKNNYYLDLTRTEWALTKVCFQMERNGVKIDDTYTKEALSHEEKEINKAKDEFRAATGITFSDGRTCLSNAFRVLGESYPTTEKGNPSFTEAVLEQMTTPVAQMVNKIRKHQKRAATYYSSFLYFADENKIVHPNMRQSGTETGRFSYSDPNLQNVPKEDEDPNLEFYVRKCFVPKYEGWPLVMIDYAQQEFRMMLDYAGQLDLIKKINEGFDPHQATAELVGIPRRPAKILNFGLLYGMGIDKLANNMAVETAVAAEYREKYFAKMPNVRRFLKQVARVGRERGYIRNWAGRRCHVYENPKEPDKDYSYILPNHLIQGGGADVLKKAMVEIDIYFKSKKMRTEMNLQVHDELVFNWHPSEFEEIPVVKKIMEDVYLPRNGMRLDCSVDHSFKSWGHFDKIKGIPIGRSNSTGVSGERRGLDTSLPQQ